MSTSSLIGIILGQNCPLIHSLLLADDLLICGLATTQDATTMKEILQTFCTMSGQALNWSKLGIIFSKHVH
jgi:hypothetical protein